MVVADDLIFAADLQHVRIFRNNIVFTFGLADFLASVKLVRMISAEMAKAVR